MMIDQFITALVSNKIFLAVASSFFLAQFLKFVSYSIKFKEIYWRGLFESGGLPSGHSAVVASLTTMVYCTQGLSALFYAILFISAIIMYDATGVRRETGKQGAILNSIIRTHRLKVDKPLKEHVGHSPIEVFFGAMIGILVAMLYAI